MNNNLPFNTSIHFHGIEYVASLSIQFSFGAINKIRQKGTPWSDGVPGLTQWAIQPGQSYTYKWHANDYGTYWYDSNEALIKIKPSSYTQVPWS